jgi:hypothetical protein
MPKELTAENGAKQLLIGEFNETIILNCPNCDDGCSDCDEEGSFTQTVPVSWSNIKKIYAMIVKNFGI